MANISWTVAFKNDVTPAELIVKLVREAMSHWAFGHGHGHSELDVTAFPAIYIYGK